MVFSVTQIQFLQRLVQDRPARRRCGEVALFLSDHYSVGKVVGRSVEYTQRHHALAESLLRNHDLPVAPVRHEASRSDIASFGGLSEKSLSAAPHSGSIGVKVFGQCTIEGRPLSTPRGTYLVVTPEFAKLITCERLMLVENLETFRCLEEYGWLRFCGKSVLAVFRGDPSLPIGDALAVIRARSEPIWAFVDFDPAGLVIANALPQERLEDILLPESQWLRQAANSARGRQLFASQVDGCANTLDQTQHPVVRVCWSEMRKLKSGVTQERMLRAAHADE